MKHGYLWVGALAIAAMIGCQDAMERTFGYRDEKITAKVEVALRSNVPGTVQVNTRDGVVTLSGTVPDATSRERAADIAAKTSGVARVNNNLRATIAADAPAQNLPPLNPPPAPQMR